MGLKGGCFDNDQDWEDYNHAMYGREEKAWNMSRFQEAPICNSQHQNQVSTTTFHSTSICDGQPYPTQL